MELKILSVDLERDYEHLRAWWEARKFPPPDRKFLPPVGGLVLVEGTPVCAGFLFQSDANAAIMGNIVSDPAAPGPVRHLALDFLVTALIEQAQDRGFGVICCSTNLEGLMGRFEGHGFVKTDEGVSHFGRLL
jgi:hypothetical protein